MSTKTKADVRLDILRRLQGPNRNLSPAAARGLLDLHFASEDQERMRKLAAKAQAGALSPSEQEESEFYDLVGHLLAVLHARARKALRDSGGV